MTSLTNEKSLKILFLSFYSRNYSRSSVLLNQESKGVAKEFYQIRSGLCMFKDLHLITRKNSEENVVYVVMSPSSLITLVLKVLTKSKIILDCGWPLMDGFLSRSKNKFHVLKYLKIKLIDLASLRSADLILAESEQQINKIVSDFKIPRHKIRVSYTGFDESRVATDHTDLTPALLTQRYVLFRGKWNEESGIESIISVFKFILTEINLVIITNTKLVEAEGAPNIKVIESFLPDDEVFNYIANSEMCLGQLSDHPRLMRTIPHKSFESAYFGIPYISRRTEAMIEAFPESCGVHYIEKIDVLSIAEAILKIYNNEYYRHQLSIKILEHFNNELSQKKISAEFLKIFHTKQLN